MRVIIAGSRTINDYIFVQNCIEEFLEEIGEITVILSGTAKGVDSLGERYARAMDITLETYPAAWEEAGKMAGSIRNQKMAENADAVILIWDGESRGNKDMLYKAKRAGLIIKEFKS